MASVLILILILIFRGIKFLKFVLNNYSGILT
jgi:hypothetical protein